MGILQTAKWKLKTRASSLAERLGVGTYLYEPYRRHEDAYALPIPSASWNGHGVGSLPVPPRSLWCGYGSNEEEYLGSGRGNTEKMLELAAASGFELTAGKRVLDLGCAAGRMLRHLEPHAADCEIWGTDITAEHIFWCKANLSPPFHFATTTTIPHLPFEDRYFDLIYCGSVFTHIEDLADSWMSELRRVLSSDGRFYVTIHDRHTSDLLDSSLSSVGLAKRVKQYDVYNRNRNEAAMIVIGRATDSQVFYDIDYFTDSLCSMFRVHSVTQEAYGKQTAVLLSRRDGAGSR